MMAMATIKLKLTMMEARLSVERPTFSRSCAMAQSQTTRFVRGRVLDVLRGLAPDGSISLLDLDARLAPLLAAHAPGAVANAVATLKRDGLVAGAEELRLSDGSYAELLKEFRF